MSVKYGDNCFVKKLNVTLLKKSFLIKLILIKLFLIFLNAMLAKFFLKINFENIFRSQGRYTQPRLYAIIY